MRKSTGCDTAWWISLALAGQIKARAHAKTRRTSVEARPSPHLPESSWSRMVVVTGGSGTSQYLAVPRRCEEHINCNQRQIFFSQTHPKHEGLRERQRRFGESKVFLKPTAGEQFQEGGFIFAAMPSLNVPAPTVRVISVSFPSLRKVGDLYSRFDLRSGGC